MHKAIAPFVVLLVALLGGALYWAAGAGWFWPCESVGRLYNGGACYRILELPDRPIGGVAEIGNSSFLVAADPPLAKPHDPISIVELFSFDTDQSVVQAQTDLPTAGHQAFVARMAVNPQETLIALRIAYDRSDVDPANQPPANGVRIFNRDGSLAGEVDPPVTGYMALTEDRMLLSHRASINDDIPSSRSIAAYDLARPDAPVPANPADTAGFFTMGRGLVVTADGETFIQKMQEGTRSPQTGLRVASMAEPTRPGLLLTVDIPSICAYDDPVFAISPNADDHLVAASFSCGQRWGEVRSSLVVWDYRSGDVVLHVPTQFGFSRLLWPNDFSLIAARFNQQSGAGELFRINLPR